MASVTKFTDASVSVNLRHVEREIANPSNQDIDRTKSSENYSLISHGERTTYQYYRERLEQLHHHNRADVKTMCGWVVTAPHGLTPEECRKFFTLTNDFLQERYGANNGISSIVHMDESGQPHLHYYFIPVVPDTKHGGEKVCCCEVLNRAELQQFHPALQQYLADHGCNAKVMSGVTKANGGNRTVEQLKGEREIQLTRSRERQREIEWEV